MTDISRFIGPKPDVPQGPLVPTPWYADNYLIKDANGHKIAIVSGAFFNVPAEIEISKFIADAVNEKIARDSTPPEKYRLDVEYWRVRNRAFYRLLPEDSRSDGLGSVEGFYPEDTRPRAIPDVLNEKYVRENRKACSVYDVPEPFRVLK